MADVVIDTSVWVWFFRSGSHELSDQVERLIEEDRAVLAGPVLTELLAGVRSEREQETLQSVFSILPFLDAERRDWEQAGWVLRALRERGIIIPLTDALIGAMARRKSCQVLTVDKHFDHLEVGRLAAAGKT